jgi:pyruvate dehydrogenase E2 component (dihydrolipoamide acetyltransferase)
MAKSFKLPDLGEGIHEGEVLAVPVEVAQEVKEGDIILEVETDKAAVAIPSPYTGSIQEIFVKSGDIVNVGDVMMTFTNGGGEQTVKEEKPIKEPVAPAETVAVATRLSPAPKEGPVPASPATRRLARELGVDLHWVTATGPAGLVTAEDVRQFAQNGKADKDGPATSVPVSEEVQPLPISEPPLPDFTRWGSVERVPFRSIRRATGKQMTLAWSLIPHVNSQDVVKSHCHCLENLS